MATSYLFNNLSDDEQKELLKLYKSGKYTITDMSEWFGVSRYIIEKHIKKLTKKTAL